MTTEKNQNLQKRKGKQDSSSSQKPGANNVNQKDKIPQQDHKKKNVKETKGKTEGLKEHEVQGSLIQRSMCYLFEETDASYLIVFRVLWGIIMAYEALTYILDDFQKVHSSFYSQIFSFKYYGFEWCQIPEDPTYLYALMIALFILGINITIGFFYRVSALLFTIGFGYMYMLEQTMYLNHFYLVTILSFMMIFLPCNCFFSVDALLWPSSRKETAPAWCLIFIRAELVIVYTFAGIVKINEDWLRSEPLLDWLSTRGNVPFIGWLLIRESTAYFMSYAGMIFDLIVGPVLLIRKLRWFGVAASVFFHCSNKLVFNIGIFPWMMLASTTFFFDRDWPRRIISFITNPSGKYVPKFKSISLKNVKVRKLTITEKVILILLTLFILHQALTPIRNYFYHGDVAWNEYGHQFSWRMKLRTKKCDLFTAITVADTAHIVPIPKILSRRQYRKVSSRPDMIIQLAHYLRDHTLEQLASRNQTGDPEIYMSAWCQLNSRPLQPLTNPYIDLAKEEKWQYPYSWVTDLDPLLPEHHKGYPWNWEWNFNWLKGIDSTENHHAMHPLVRYDALEKEIKASWYNFFKKRNPNTVFLRWDEKLPHPS